MFYKILNFKIPLYIAVLVLAIFVGGLIFWVRSFREPIQNYYLVLPENNGVEHEFAFGSWPALANADFFEQVKNRFIAGKTSFIEANLSTMRLVVYEKGAAVKEVPILTKGKEGFWWETPAGLYKVEDKLENHFSGFAGVYLPWSLPFQGNFFIHGWPYYPDGTPVISGYSGGCIRLSTEDAKTVFELAKIGMPVLVFKQALEKDAFQYRLKHPQLSAESYLAADLINNFVFAEESSTKKLPIASLTKLMTALVAVEYVNIEREIEITGDMLVKTSRPRLKAGEILTLFQLLHPLLMESSNEAAIAISNFLGPARFVELMNQKAKAIGMNNTRFADPAGSDNGNISTAQDLFMLAKYLYDNRSFILKISAGKIDKSAYGPPLFSNLENYNVPENEPGFVGGKVGMSGAAKETILSIFDLRFNNTKRPVAVVILGSADRTLEMRTFLAWIRENYEGDTQ